MCKKKKRRKKKMQISFAVTSKMTIAFVFTTWIVTFPFLSKSKISSL